MTGAFSYHHAKVKREIEGSTQPRFMSILGRKPKNTGRNEQNEEESPSAHSQQQSSDPSAGEGDKASTGVVDEPQSLDHPEARSEAQLSSQEPNVEEETPKNTGT